MAIEGWNDLRKELKARAKILTDLVKEEGKPLSDIVSAYVHGLLFGKWITPEDHGIDTVEEKTAYMLGTSANEQLTKLIVAFLTNVVMGMIKK